MSARRLTLADLAIGEIDRAINVLWATPHARRPAPGASVVDSAAGEPRSGEPAPGAPTTGEPAAGAPVAGVAGAIEAGGAAALSERARIEAARLMRVNHAGEVAAQALYRGQALTARNPGTAHSMRQAAAEEMDHLAWCDER